MNEPCTFCANFDFSTVSTAIEKVGDKTKAYIVLAGGNHRYDLKDQFNHCPNCGRELSAKERGEDL